MKPTHKHRLLPNVLLAFLFSMFFGVSAFAAEETSVTAPAGNQNYSFAIDLVVNESVSYAGIQFGLTLSSEGAMTFDSFTLGTDVSRATAYPFIASNGVHSFGFWTGANAFQGNLKVGTLHFTYMGSAPQTITITDMMVARVDSDAKTSFGTKKASPAYVIHVSRGGGAAGGAGNSGGGSGSSGNTEIAIDISDEGTPLAAGNPFTDVNTNDWFYDDVMYVYAQGLMNGTGPDAFSPQLPTTRGMIVTVLYRAAGSPPVPGLDNPFDDVAGGGYYSDAVKWGAANKIILGYNANTFGPEDNILREQLAAILYRYEQFCGKTPTATAADRTFADENRVSDYAKGAVNALVTQGIINGKPPNLFDPQGQATRAEVAAVFHRFLEAAE
ncbi:MAG: S-layer homology domain-containing protein [Clostridiales Family XIII bacterium]|nr:S-layer homology domain-containing protein [Clostridiales Family XIII bacterium]